MGTISIICESFNDVGEVSTQVNKANLQKPEGIDEGSNFNLPIYNIPFNRSAKQKADVDDNELKKNIIKNIKTIISLFDEDQFSGKGYEVSELEFNLSISADASVSLFSAFSAGVSGSSGITVRIKKK